jgi:predicted site-specific integrase-resolvase
VKLKRWAEGRRVSYATARHWFESGELPVPARRAGRLIRADDAENTGTTGVAPVCASMSSVDREAGRDRQVARAAGKGSPWSAS